MFNQTALLLALALSPAVQATEGSEEARWLRSASISPDGQHIAFSYAGDLWVAPVGDSEGKPVEAALLTTHVGYETNPIWAPDSQAIAFAADWFGQMDIFVTSLDRAPARRLTFHSAGDTPTCFSPDGKELWFSSRRQDTAEARIGSGVLSEFYAVDVEGGAPRQILTTPAELACPSADGSTVLYQDLKSFENQWRKHHVSSMARDIWKWNPATGEHTQLTSWRGEDRNPVFVENDTMVAFLSEREGSSNVFVAPIDRLGEARPLTLHEEHPVRFLSAADDGTLAYTYDGEVWIKSPGAPARHQPILARADQRANPLERKTFRDRVGEMAVSPDEDEVAFVVRGEVFVSSIDHGTTRRVTETPEQERSVTWGKDGRTLYYASERDGSWSLYSSTIVREEEDGFSSSTLLREEPLVVGEEEAFQPVASPDGKYLAYVVDRDAIHVFDLETKESREVVSDYWNYSYSDGDMGFAWSPDSQWLTIGYSPNLRLSGDAGAVRIDGGEIVNISESGYGEGNSKFSPDGKAILYTTNRFGQQEHSGRGGQGDVIATYLTQAAYDEATLSWEELERVKELEKKAKEKAKEKDDAKDDAKDEDAVADAEASDEPEAGAEEAKDEDEEAVEPIELDPTRLDQRRRRLTLQSAPIGDVVMTPDGEAVIYMAEVDGKWDVWTSHLRDRKTQRLLKLGGGGGGELYLTKDGKTLLIRTSKGTLTQAKISAGKRGLPESAKPEPIAFAAEMTIDGPAERAHMFEHSWRQMRDKFYRADLHGADWDGLKEDYASFLPHIHNGYDFAELLSEMLGETNASHTGASYRPRGRESDDTASLGLIYGGLSAEGMRIDEVIAGGPADRSDSALGAGVHITAIDGQPLTPDENPWPLLDRKSRKPVLLTCTGEDGESFDEVIKPLSSGAERELMYQRWIQRSEDLVTELSDGRVGYVHVRGMNDRSYREVYEQVLGRGSDCEALIVDTRWNGGGWLHDQLVTFLGGDQYCTFVPRGKEPGRYGGEPSSRWSRPVCVVQNEGNYSDAHFFPYSFKTLGLGKLIGTPVAGTSTAVWWETMVDGSTTFGIPQLGVQDMNGNYLENQELMPDIEVYNDPESTAAGRDLQLETAVHEMLKEANQVPILPLSASTPAARGTATDGE